MASSVCLSPAGGFAEALSGFSPRDGINLTGCSVALLAAVVQFRGGSALDYAASS